MATTISNDFCGFPIAGAYCFSINFNHYKKQTFIVKSLPKWAKKDDTVVAFGGLVPDAENVIGLPYPKKILLEPSLKKKIWSDLSKFLKRNSD